MKVFLRVLPNLNYLQKFEMHSIQLSKKKFVNIMLTPISITLDK